MSKIKVHYQNPRTKLRACGLGNPLTSQVTSNIKAVTCQLCLKTATAKKRLPGRPSTGDAKILITLRLPKKMLDWIDTQPGDRTSIIMQAIEQTRQKLITGD